MARPDLQARSAWDGVADALAATLRTPRDASSLRARHVEPTAVAGRLAAVDGGSALVLEGNGLAVGAVRAAGLAWRDHEPALELQTPLELRLLDADLARELDAKLPGLPPAEGPTALLERWRALREHELALQLAGRLGEGDVLAVDGPLAQRDWPPGHLQALAEATGPRGVALAGVCKSTSVTLHGVPALLEAARAARGVPEPWAAGLPGEARGVRSHAVRFLRGARVFKVELLPHEDPLEVLGRLAPWTLDAGYPGYPYPLALVHNRCALDEGLVADLGHQLRALLAERGVDAATWEEVFGDFHDVLDRGV